MLCVNQDRHLLASLEITPLDSLLLLVSRQPSVHTASLRGEDKGLGIDATYGVDPERRLIQELG